MARKETNFAPAPITALPADYPAWRLLENLKRLERNDPGVQGVQVQSFMLLDTLHAYIAGARREIETTIGAPLCQEHCCCTNSTPIVSRLEAEYIISTSGYYSDLVRLATDWMLDAHEEAPTYLKDLPQAPGARAGALPAIGREFKALAHRRSPFLVAGDSHSERLTFGPYVKTSYAAGTAYANHEYRDLLGNTQPLVCATSGLFTAPPAWCHRSPGLGETVDARVVADPASLQRHYAQLEAAYRRYPEKGQYGLLPAMIVRVANPMGFERMVQSGAIAVAKIGVAPGPPIVKLWEGSYVGMVERGITSSGAGASGGTRGLGGSVRRILGR